MWVMSGFADEIDPGFVSLEPHLASAHRLGGFSGPATFVRATRASTAILDSAGVLYR